MARPVYSHLHFRAPAFSGGPTLQFIAPMGFTTVVKTISIVWGDVVVSGLDAWIQTQDLTKLVRHTIATGIGGLDVIGGCVVYWGDWTLNPLDELSTQCATGTADFYCSGYLLTLP
jgi:hypothetical protein